MVCERTSKRNRNKMKQARNHKNKIHDPNVVSIEWNEREREREESRRETATRWIKWREGSTQLECCTQTNAIISRECYNFFSVAFFFCFLLFLFCVLLGFFLSSFHFDSLHISFYRTTFIRFASQNIKIISCIVSFKTQLFAHCATVYTTFFLRHAILHTVFIYLFVQSFLHDCKNVAFYSTERTQTRDRDVYTNNQPTTNVQHENKTQIRIITF